MMNPETGKLFMGSLACLREELSPSRCEITVDVLSVA